MRRVVLDASALMTLFEDRPGAGIVEVLLAEALEGKRELLMSVVNWGEVYYSIWRARGQGTAEGAIAEVSKLPLRIVDADPELTKVAAAIRAQHKLPYADCFAAALADRRKAELATADKDFALVERLVKILWTVGT